MLTAFRRRPVALLGLLMLILSVAGCGGPHKLSTVTGTLRYQGQPVPKVIVYFVPEDGRASWGLTNDEGVFSLQFDRKTPGAVAGKSKVYLEYRQTSPTAPATPPPELEPLLEKYGHLDNTPLSYEVTQDGQNIAINLD